MNDAVNQWLERKASLKGLLACGVRYPDENMFFPSTGPGLPRERLEYSLRCIADTLQVLKVNGFPNEQIRWTYQSAILHCVKRTDGAFLVVFTSKDPGSIDLKDLERMLAEFLTVGTMT